MGHNIVCFCFDKLAHLNVAELMYIQHNISTGYTVSIFVITIQKHDMNLWK